MTYMYLTYILHEQFKSTFTTDDTTTMPDKGQSSHARNKDGVIKLLKSVNLHKATGLDNLPAHFLNN